MKNTFNVKVLYHFYHSAVKAELKRRGFSKDVSGKIKNTRRSSGEQKKSENPGF